MDDTHPIRPRPADLRVALVTTVTLIGLWWALGEAIVHSPTVLDADESVSRWFADHRNPVANALSWFGSELGDTIVKIAVTLIAVVWAWRHFRRWQEPTMIAAPLAIEATTFIVVTHLVDRPRPDVPPLETSFVHSSFPSGHVAAAAVYAGMAVVIAWHAASPRARRGAFAAVAVVTAAVALGRLHRGMHHLSDVLAGALLGVVCVVVVARRLRRSVPETVPTPSRLAEVNVSPACPASLPAASRVP